MIAGLVVSLLLTQLWKISIHAGVAAGTVVVLCLVFGPVGNAAWPLVAAIGWSRVELEDHTLAQVIGGSVIGAIVAGASFTVLS